MNMRDVQKMNYLNSVSIINSKTPSADSTSFRLFYFLFLLQICRFSPSKVYLREKKHLSRYCTRTRLCARANDAKIVRSRDAQCNFKESPQ